MSVVVDASVDVGDEFGELLRAVVAFGTVDGLELCTVDRHQFGAEQVELAADQVELAQDRLEAFAALVQWSDRRLAGSQITSRLRVVSGSRRRLADALEAAVDVKLEQHRWVIGRTAGCGRRREKTERRQIELLDERVDHPHRCLRRHVVFHSRRQQLLLLAVFSLDVTHPCFAALRINKIGESFLTVCHEPGYDCPVARFVRSGMR